jgi:hypothetical protein
MKRPSRTENVNPSSERKPYDFFVGLSSRCRRIIATKPFWLAVD